MNTQHHKVLEFFKFRKILLPVLLGLGVAFYLVYRNFDPGVFKTLRWNNNSYVFLFLALVLMAVRDLSYMYRIRILTDKQLSWRKSFDVIMLWEFASAVTPSVIGGSAVALYIVHREGIGMGRTTAIVMITALLDELFYIVMVPIVFLIVGTSSLFISEGQYVLFNTKFGTQGIFVIGYFVIIVLTSIIIYGVFINPRGLKYILLSIFRIPFLRRWRVQAGQTADEIITTSSEMKGKPVKFWLKAFGGTFLSWTARFWVVNCLILAFINVDNHFLIYARQLIMWVILMISPTPGGSGVAEIVFSGFLGEFIPKGFAAPLGVLWRGLSYYPYLFIGVIILPYWLKRVYHSKKISSQNNNEKD